MDDRAAKSLETFVKVNVLPSSRVTTDGWVGYNNLAALDMDSSHVREEPDAAPHFQSRISGMSSPCFSM